MLGISLNLTLSWGIEGPDSFVEVFGQEGSESASSQYAKQSSWFQICS
jgi:hypothetical protein